MKESSIKKISAAIKHKALELGFADCGFARAEALPEDARHLRDWLDEDLHGSMGYMANHFEKRIDPTQLVPGARSVISLLYNYYTEQKQQDPEAPILSTYAYGRDYHFVLKEKLFQLLDFIREMVPGTKGRVFVDSAPVLDRAWAREAGLGWIGKNSQLISRKWGSFVFIGELILNLDLEYNSLPESDFCGSCNRCIEACPTAAIRNNRTLDARRCISYQTIENRGEISTELKGRLQGRVFGCDICQDVCPWNRKAIQHQEKDFQASADLLALGKEEWYEMTEESYQELFQQSPVERAGYQKLKSTLSFIRKS